MSRKAYTGLMAARRPGEKWPRLSLELTEIRHPEFCQSCGTHESDMDEDTERWREHDDQDQPQPVLVVLCQSCSKALIDPHPRLYEALPENAPWPGCMPLCADCRFRRGLDCAHEAAKANGGPGVTLTMPKPHTVFWHGRTGPKGGRRTGGVWTEYPGPVSECAMKEAAGQTDGVEGERHV